ncbi:hypothetical protein CWS02_00230 [Enterobacter sp. EA-1]|nr:hypothetical protein CWS02_00230 [Enterobacter sp. EA-1]
MTLSGSHKTGGAITVNSTQDVALNGATLAADGKLTLSGSGNTTLTGSSLTSGGEMAISGKQIATDAASQANAAGNVHLNASDINQQGSLISGADMTPGGRQRHAERHAGGKRHAQRQCENAAPQR